VHRPQSERLQDHDFQGSREKLTMFGILCHVQQLNPKYLFLE
jgi:hypothetical protein